MLAFAAWSMTAFSAVGEPSVETMKSTCCWTSDRICWICVVTSFGVGGVVTTIFFTSPGFSAASAWRPFSDVLGVEVALVVGHADHPRRARAWA